MGRTAAWRSAYSESGGFAGRSPAAATRAPRTPASAERMVAGAASAHHAPEADVRRGRVDRLALSRGRAVAQAVVRRAEMRSALDDAPRDRVVARRLRDARV